MIYILPLLDRKLEKGVTNGQKAYASETVYYTDYYPFGFPMPKRFGRTLYRYGFNGQEKDNEIYGDGQSYDFGARLYDTRISRWFSVDPKYNNYPYISSYSFALNNPLLFKDILGEKIYIYYQNEAGENLMYEYGSKIEVPDNAFVQNSINALNTLIETKSAQGDIEFFKNSEKYNVYLNQSISNRAEFTIGSAEVNSVTIANVGKRMSLFWNPEKAFKNKVTGKVILPIISLYHEFRHYKNAIDNPLDYLNRRNTSFEGSINEKWSDAEEKYNIETFEHPLSRELDMDLRNRHNNLDIEYDIFKSDSSTEINKEIE